MDDEGIPVDRVTRNQSFNTLYSLLVPALSRLDATGRDFGNTMSSDHTISDLDINWSSSDDDQGVDSRIQNVDRRVTIEDPSTSVSINARGMLEQGAVYAIASAVERPKHVDIPESSTSLSHRHPVVH
ncbi:hypothetical protein QYF36_016892 [Acer negundo]|nr:hypothetical protein QYF36_016892 [Acer negundo]